MKLFGFQKKAVSFLLGSRYRSLFLSMSMGKTLVTLFVLEAIKWWKGLPPTLIVGPIFVIESTWPDEIKKWNFDLTYRLLRGKDRLKLLREDADIHMINFELLTWLCEQPEARKFKILVVDELYRLHNTKTASWRALIQYRKGFERVIGLTGTPTGGRLHSLYGQMKLVTGNRIWGTKKDFQEKYFVNRSRSFNYENWKIRDKTAEEGVYADIKPHVMTLHEKDYLELPKYVYKDLWFNLPDELQTAYDTFEEELFWLVDDVEEIFAKSHDGARQKLRQIISGFLYNEKGEPIHIDYFKLWMARELLATIDSPVIIMYQLREEKRQFIESVKAKPFKTSLLKKWNARKISRLVAHPNSLCYGLNMQQGGHYMLWYSLPWSVIKFNQASARLRRIGQPHPVNIIRILFKNTIDEAIVKTHNADTAQEHALYDALAEYKSHRWSP